MVSSVSNMFEGSDSRQSNTGILLRDNACEALKEREEKCRVNR